MQAKLLDLVAIGDTVKTLSALPGQIRQPGGLMRAIAAQAQEVAQAIAA